MVQFRHFLPATPAGAQVGRRERSAGGASRRASRQARAFRRRADRRRSRSGRRSDHGGDLDEVAAGVVEDGRRHRAHRGRRLRERHAQAAQPLVLGVDVVDGEARVRNAVRDERLLEGACGGVAIGLKEELDAVRLARRDDGKSSRISERDLGLLHEAKDIGVEAQRLLLVVDQDAGDVDSHESLSLERGRHRSAMAFSGAGWM